MAKPLVVLSAVRGFAGCWAGRPGGGRIAVVVVVVGLVLGGCGSGSSGGAVPESCEVPDAV